QSALLAEAFGIEAGDAPPVDLAAERRNGDFVRSSRRLIRACTDLSDGGLALAAFEMAEGAGLGVRIDAGETGFLFGEDQARYLLAVAQGDLAALQAAAQAAGVTLALVGQFGGAEVVLGGDSAPLADLSRLYRTAFAATVGL
nr:AIR synthase-related protein [Tabrizicola sp.]